MSFSPSEPIAATGRVVFANHLVGNIDRRRRPQQTALLQDDRVSAAFAHVADHVCQVANDGAGHFVVFLLQLVLGVLVSALEIAQLAGIVVLQIAPLLVPHQHALLVQFVLERLDLALLTLKFALQARDFGTELVFCLVPGVGIVQRPLHVNESDLEIRRCRGGGDQREKRHEGRHAHETGNLFES